MADIRSLHFIGFFFVAKRATAKRSLHSTSIKKSGFFDGERLILSSVPSNIFFFFFFF